MSQCVPYILRSQVEVIEGEYIHYILHLAACEEVAVTMAPECNQPMIVHASSGACIATGLVDIIHWLSYRSFRSAELLQSLCGSTKEERRCIARGLKKVLSWTSDWSDTNTPVNIQLKDPLCKAVLLDKMMRHRRMVHFLDSPHTQGGVVARLTAADVLLILLLQPWLAAFAKEHELIIGGLPAIVIYVKGIRSKLRAIECAQTNSAEECSSGFTACDSLWVDAVDIQIDLSAAFKFTQKGSARDDRKEAIMTVTTHDAGLLDATAQELIGRAPWLKALEHNNDAEHRSVEPYSLKDPLWRHMCLPAGREVRKAQQISSLLQHALRLLPPGGVAVEFCSGGGYVGIPLAYLRPDCTVLLTDMNSVSLKFAEQRVAGLGLRNVQILRTELSHIESNMGKCQQANKMEDGGSAAEKLLTSFHLGLSLHACGPGTDAVLRICRARGASCVASPCCYGFMQHAMMDAELPVEEADVVARAEGLCRCADAPDRTYCTECCPGPGATTAPPPYTTRDSTRRPQSAYPQSQAFREAGWQAAWFAALCARADRTFWTHDSRAPAHNTAGRLAMRAVDADRLLCMQEAGYEVFGTHMVPAEASVKNHVLVCVCRKADC